MNQEMLEILIGRFIDSEITPAEQRLLDAELQANPQARQLLEQWQQLHEQARQALNAEVTEQGASAEVIFNRALAQRQTDGLRKNLPWWRAVVPLAAALLLGLGLYLMLPEKPVPEQAANAPDNPPSETVVADKNENENMTQPENAKPSERIVEMIPPPRIGRGIDYYIYTDPSGAQWLLESPPQDQIRPAVYNGDL